MTLGTPETSSRTSLANLVEYSGQSARRMSLGRMSLLVDPNGANIEGTQANSATIQFFKKKDRVEEIPEGSNIELVAVELGDISLQVECTGRVEANREVEIKSKASGEVVELPFDISDFVFQEDLLVKLDPLDEDRRVKQTRVALASSQASLRSAEARAREMRAKFEHVKKLFEKNLANAEELEIAETSYIQADAAREMAEAEVASDELNLAVAAAIFILCLAMNLDLFQPISNGDLDLEEELIAQIFEL